MTGSTDIRCFFPSESEKVINSTINNIFYAKFVYTNMKYFFQRSDVSLTGFSRLISCKLESKYKQVENLMNYLNKRGGKIVIQDIPKPKNQEWKTGLQALQESLEMEKKLYQILNDAVKTVNKKNDNHLSYFLTTLIEEQISIIRSIGDSITQLTKTNAQGLGEYMFDKDLLRRI